LLFLLSLLLFEDLAEHILLELAACLNADIWDKTSWSEEDVDWMKQSIIVLMEAAGEPIGTHDTSVLSIEQLLEAFVVGTEKGRNGSRGYELHQSRLSWVQYQK